MRYRTALRLYRRAVAAYADATRRVMELDAEKPDQKRMAILRIMEQLNPLTNKPHSATSAEAVVELDTDYALWLARYRGHVVEQILAEGQRQATWAALTRLSRTGYNGY